MKKRIVTFLLPLIIILAVVLRFTGTYPGFHPNHSDENFLYSIAIEMLRHGTIEPFRYEYPALTPIINLVFYNLFFIPGMWIKFLILNLGNIIDGLIRIPLQPDVFNRVMQLEVIGARDLHTIFWSRSITALFGVGIVCITYLVAKKMFTRSVGLTAALLVTVNYRQVLNSHFALPDVYNGFFILLGFLLVLFIWERRKLSYYILAGIVFGATIAIKYQPFSFIPLIAIHLDSIKSLINKKLILVPVIAFLVFALLNPYFFMNFERAMADISYASVKYASGRNVLDFYSYSYLFKWGIGPLTSLLVIIGVIFGLRSETKKSILILSLLIPFFYFWTVYSSGGFYTRNFVSITPFLLIFGAFGINYLSKYIKKYVTLFVVIILTVTVWENLSRSIVVIQEYTKPWNTTLTVKYIQKNIASDAKVSAHSSVPLMDSQTRLPYEIDQDYSMEEFLESGAEYAITNLDWTSVDYYWWMRQSTAKSLEYWNKPLHLMENTYRALSLRELQQFVTFSEINSYLAPDSDFFVTKLPTYTVTNKQIVKNYNDFSTWKESSNEVETLQKEAGVLALKRSTPQDPSAHWFSEKIEVNEWQGFEVDFEIKNENGSKADGFAYTKFFNDKDEELGIRLSSRNQEYGMWGRKSFVGTVPANSDYMRLYFQAYNYLHADISLRRVVVYNASVHADFGNANVKKLEINENNVYPNSHGNL